jgi:hypothetical protein
VTLQAAAGSVRRYSSRQTFDSAALIGSRPRSDRDIVFANHKINNLQMLNYFICRSYNVLKTGYPYKLEDEYPFQASLWLISDFCADRYRYKKKPAISDKTHYSIQCFCPWVLYRDNIPRSAVMPSGRKVDPPFRPNTNGCSGYAINVMGPGIPRLFV